jgi:hypothetical protein
MVEIDTSNLVITGVLSQHDDIGILHLLAYLLRRHLLAEINYEIYNKKLLVLICAFKKWCSLLEGSLHTIEVISNHWHLIYFTAN